MSAPWSGCAAQASDTTIITKDLQTVSPEELAKAKETMSIKFQQNFITPDDPRYVHDKVVDFDAVPKEANDWDDDDGEDL
jgi:hypothetical protein